MINVTDTKTLVPENDLQELWQMSGRVEAVVAFLHSELDAGYIHVDANRLLSMLERK